MTLLNLMMVFELLHLDLIHLDLLHLDLIHQATQELVQVVQLAPVPHLSDGLLSQLHFEPQFDHSILAQKLDTDVFRGVRGFWNYFLRSGQIWALAIGLVVGYAFRSLTNYG